MASTVDHYYALERSYGNKVRRVCVLIVGLKTLKSSLSFAGIARLLRRSLVANLLLHGQLEGYMRKRKYRPVGFWVKVQSFPPSYSEQIPQWKK